MTIHELSEHIQSIGAKLGYIDECYFGHAMVEEFRASEELRQFLVALSIRLSLLADDLDELGE